MKRMYICLLISSTFLTEEDKGAHLSVTVLLKALIIEMPGGPGSKSP